MILPHNGLYLHKEKPNGQRRRGKRTIAKEKLYKHILKKICEMKPNFNIGISTGTEDIEDRWHHPYRHWLLSPKNLKRMRVSTNKKDPVLPTSIIQGKLEPSVGYRVITNI